jgi:hypothetical protein
MGTDPFAEMLLSFLNMRRLLTGRLIVTKQKRRPGFDPGSAHVGFVVDIVALGQVFSRVLSFSSVNFFPAVLHYLEKRKKLIIFLFILIKRVAQ